MDILSKTAICYENDLKENFFHIKLTYAGKGVHRDMRPNKCFSVTIIRSLIGVTFSLDGGILLEVAMGNPVDGNHWCDSTYN